MVFAEVAIHSGGEFSEFFFKMSSNLCVCFTNKVHSEAKTLVNKTRKVTDVFRGSVYTLFSLGLSCLEFQPLGLVLSLLVQDELYMSIPSFFEFFVSHK